MLRPEADLLRRGETATRCGAWRGLARWLSLALLILGWSIAAAQPADVILVLDNSGSMRKNDPQFLLRPAVSGFVADSVDDTRIGMVIFDHTVRYAVPLAPLSNATREALARSLEGIDYRGQFTDSPAAIERAIYELKANAREDVARVIVFMTDGIVDTGNAAIDAEKAAWLRDELAADAADNEIRIFGIAFTDEADFFLIQSLAKKTGGEYFRAPRAEQLGEVFAIIRQRLAAPSSAAQPAPAPAVAAAPAAVAATGPAEVAPAAPAALARVPAAAPATCLDSLSAEERLAMEETAPEVGITAEEMCREMEAAGAGSVIMHAPPEAGTTPAALPEDDYVGVVLVIALGILLLVLLGIVALIIVRRRRRKAGAGTAATLVSAAQIPEAYLEDTQGTTPDGQVRLGTRPLLIGRVAGTDPEHIDYYVIDKGTVGRRHALIQYRDLAFWLSDQESVNGTFLNGERISSERRLKHGDRIRFHKYEFQFSMPELDAADHTVFATSHDATIAADATQIGAAVVATAAVRTAPRPRSDEGDMFDITAEGQTDDDAADDQPFAAAGEPERAPEQAQDGDGGAADTALSARRAPAEDDLFDSEGATELPVRAVEAAVDDGGMAGFANHSATGSGDAFDNEASAFFDDDLDSTAADDGRAASFAPAAGPRGDDEFASVLPDAPASADSGEFSESETLLPNAPYADGDASGTAVDISLDEFMETESFYNQRPDAGDRADPTLMPEQVPHEVTMTPEYGDMFDSTVALSAGDEKPDAEDKDEEDDAAGTESPTRGRD